jgi:GntR family transcriptional repressor for pyruvate dehydrogenase complex
MTPRENGPEKVVAFIRGLIECGSLRPGGRLPAERRLSEAIGVGRVTVRSGIQALGAMGLVATRHGSGTYVLDGPPRLGSGSFQFFEVLHRVSCDEMYEARRVLEVDVAGLAAERATSDEIAALGAEVTTHLALVHDPASFLAHDIAFHRMLSVASRNPILATLVEMVSAAYYERRSRSAPRAPEAARRTAAEMHRDIYVAVRSRKAAAARKLMHDHIVWACDAQAREMARDVASARP